MNADASDPRPSLPPLPPLPPRAWLRYDVVSRIVAEVAPRTVLELGCGQGAVGARLALRAEYVGVEPDDVSAAVAAARVGASGGRVIHGDHTRVDPDTAYDLVCAFEVLEHLEDDAGTLAQWVAFARPGGHVLVSVPAWPARFGAMDTHAGHYRRYEPAALRGLLERAGLVDVRLRLYAWPLGYALEAVRHPIDGRKLARLGHASPEELTAASGRTFQPPNPLVGKAVELATLPFRRLQRLAPDRGTGLVALARRP